MDLFPVVWHYEGNIGPYIPAGCITTVDPESGIHNSAFQRCWVKSPKRLPSWVSIPSHNWRNIMRWWARGEDAPVAIWAGHHPSAFAGAVSYGRISGYPEDHYPHMGAALGEPLRLVASELFGDRLKVPADAEVIIEGVVPRNVYEAEGPFAERAGYTGAQRPNPVIEVRAVRVAATRCGTTSPSGRWTTSTCRASPAKRRCGTRSNRSCRS
jgi:2,5-furandicarboxylate decarboxylase 1